MDLLNSVCGGCAQGVRSEKKKKNMVYTYVQYGFKGSVNTRAGMLTI